MKTIQVRLPERVHKQVKKPAQDEQISLNYYIVTSVANEVTRQATRDFFRGAARRVQPGVVCRSVKRDSGCAGIPERSDKIAPMISMAGKSD